MHALMVWSCADGNCIHMVDNGIVQKLMDLLDRHVEDGNVTVQHAALSALRNLAIPGMQFSVFSKLMSSSEERGVSVYGVVKFCSSKLCVLLRIIRKQLSTILYRFTQK